MFGHMKNCCNYLKIWTIWLYHRVTSPKDTDGIANLVDPGQTAPLIWVFTVCPGRSVRKLRIIKVISPPYFMKNIMKTYYVSFWCSFFPQLEWCTPQMLKTCQACHILVFILETKHCLTLLQIPTVWSWSYVPLFYLHYGLIPRQIPCKFHAQDSKTLFKIGKKR